MYLFRNNNSCGFQRQHLGSIYLPMLLDRFGLSSKPRLLFHLVPPSWSVSLPTPQSVSCIHRKYLSFQGYTSQVICVCVWMCVHFYVPEEEQKKWSITPSICYISQALAVYSSLNVQIRYTCTYNTVHYGVCTLPIQRKRDLFLKHIKHLPLIVRISSVCFTLFIAILLKSLISCIIEQPVYMSQPGCDGCVSVCVVGWTSFHFTDVIAFCYHCSGTLCHAEITSTLLVMEDIRQMIILWDRHSSWLPVFHACLLSYF